MNELDQYNESSKVSTIEQLPDILICPICHEQFEKRFLLSHMNSSHKWDVTEESMIKRMAAVGWL